MAEDKGLPEAVGEGCYHYDPAREDDPYALPDIEVLHVEGTLLAQWNGDLMEWDPPYEAGWYWWACFPGCLPDSEPCGPFDTGAEALAGARGGV